MKRKSLPSKSSKNGGSSKTSREKRRKSEGELLTSKNTNARKEQSSPPENDSSKTSRSNKKKIPQDETVATGKQRSAKNAAIEKIQKNDAGKNNNSQQQQRNKSSNSSKNTQSDRVKNDDKSNTNRRRSTSPPPPTEAPRRSSRRSEGSGELLSLSYNYPKGMHWDSFGNRWVTDDTITISTAEGPVVGTNTAAAKSKKSSPSRKRKEPEPAKEKEAKVEHHVVDKGGAQSKAENGDSQTNTSPPPEASQKGKKSTDKTASVAKEKNVAQIAAPHDNKSASDKKGSEADQFADADETDSVKNTHKSKSKNGDDGASNVGDAKKKEDKIRSQPQRKPSFAKDSETKDETKKVQPPRAEKMSSKKDTSKKEEKNKSQSKSQGEETFLVNPEDVNVNDFCFVCGVDGDLMECYAELENRKKTGCGRSFHIGCIGRQQIPSGDWLCSECARKQGYHIKTDEHPQYGHAFGEDDFEIKSGGKMQRVSLGSRIAIYWDDDNQYYNATVLTHEGGNQVEVLYDDGVRESLDLSEQKIKVLLNDGKSVGSRDRKRTSDEDRKIALLHTNDIVCGRGDSQTNWARQYGYQEFRKILSSYHSEYESIPSTTDRRALCKKIYSVIENLRLRFVSWDGNEWKPLAYSKSVDKVNQGLRDFRAGSTGENENEVDERGLRKRDIPLGYSTKKGLAYRPGYQLLRSIIASMQDEFTAAEDKRPVCAKVLDRLEKEDVRIVRIVKNDGRDDWVRVQKDKAIIRIMRAFREESGSTAPVTHIRSQGIMPSQKAAINLPPVVTQKTNGDSARHRRKFRNPKSLPTSKALAKDDRHPLLRSDPTSKRVAIEVDPAFLVQSDSDDAGTSSSSDESSLGSFDSTMNQIELIEEEFEQPSSIKHSLVDLCSRIRIGHLSREERPVSQSFESATAHESADYFYYPPPLQRRPKVSFQQDMICDLLYSSPGHKSKRAYRKQLQKLQSPVSTRGPKSPTTKKRKQAPASPPSTIKKQTKRQKVTKAVAPSHLSAANNVTQMAKQMMAVNQYPGVQPFQRPANGLGSSYAAATKFQVSKNPSLVSAKLPPAVANPLLNRSAPLQIGIPTNVPNPLVNGTPTTPNAIWAANNKLIQVDQSKPKRGRPRKNQQAKPKPPPNLSEHAKMVLGLTTQQAEEQASIRFRNYQVEVWTNHLQEAQEFRRKHGHCIIPHDYPENQDLARWAKRQRYQYQLFKNNSGKSYMTKERIQVLEELGFCWEHKSSVWFTRYHELLAYKKVHGHTMVPTKYNENRKLATWVKCQRRQMKLRESGEPNTMSDERVELLNKIDFAWQASDPKAAVEEDDGEEGEEEEEELDDDGNDDEIMVVEAPAKKPTVAKAAKKSQIPGLIKGLSDYEIGEEERRIRAKYKGGSGAIMEGLQAHPLEGEDPFQAAKATLPKRKVGRPPAAALASGVAPLASPPPLVARPSVAPLATPPPLAAPAMKNHPLPQTAATNNVVDMQLVQARIESLKAEIDDLRRKAAAAKIDSLKAEIEDLRRQAAEATTEVATVPTKSPAQENKKNNDKPNDTDVKDGNVIGEEERKIRERLFGGFNPE